VLASVPYDWSRLQLIVFAWLRTLLVPLLLLCATPRGDPLIPGEGYPMLFSLLLGVTNGLIGSVPMIQAPSRVSEEHRELTGNHSVVSASSSKFSNILFCCVLFIWTVVYIELFLEDNNITKDNGNKKKSKHTDD
jgi:solute carrier family 29 (equilibrative nucleoside transporter) protein 4